VNGASTVNTTTPIFDYVNIQCSCDISGIQSIVGPGDLQKFKNPNVKCQTGVNVNYQYTFTNFGGVVTQYEGISSSSAI